MALARGDEHRRCESGKSSNGVSRCPGAAEGCRGKLHGWSFFGAVLDRCWVRPAGVCAQKRCFQGPPCRNNNEPRPQEEAHVREGSVWW